MRTSVTGVFSGALLVLSLAGCDQLFPELTGANRDMAMGDAGGDLAGSSLTGSVCQLTDLRSPQSCSAGATGGRVTIEETRASTLVAADGTFTLSLAGVGERATVAVVDASLAGGAVPTVMQLGGAVLADARQRGVLLPAVRRDVLTSLFLQAGATEDATRGAVLAWVLMPSGQPVPGAVAARILGATGPLYDSAGSTTLADAATTGTYGAVAFVDLPPGQATLQIATPASAPVQGDAFPLPVRGGALTIAALALAPR